MKTSIRTIALATVVSFAALSQALHAQGHASSQVNVPFAFDYGSQHFPAGTYSISMRDSNILSLRSDDRFAWVMIQTGSDSKANERGYVTFRKYGERYFLAEFSPAWQSVHATVLESGAERRAARDYATNHIAPSLVELALLSNDKGVSRSK